MFISRFNAVFSQGTNPSPTAPEDKDLTTDLSVCIIKSMHQYSNIGELLNTL